MRITWRTLAWRSCAGLADVVVGETFYISFVVTSPWRRAVAWDMDALEGGWAVSSRVAVC